MRAFRGRTFALVGALLAAVLLATVALAGCADEGGDTATAAQRLEEVLRLLPAGWVAPALMRL